MRITYVVHQFFPEHYTGTERVALNLAKQMQRTGHTVRVLTYGIGVDPESYPNTLNGLRWKSYMFQGVPVLSVQYSDAPDDFALHAFPDAVLSRTLDDLWEHFACDVMHIVHPMTLAAAAETASSHNVPVVGTLTDFWVLCPRIHLLTPTSERCLGPGDGTWCSTGPCAVRKPEGWMARRRSQVERYLDAVDAIAAPSDFVVSILEANLTKPREVQVIRHGVDYQVVRHRNREYGPDSQVAFGYIGTILPNKGVLDLIDSFIGVRGETARLSIFGETRRGNQYQDKVLRSGSRDSRITFHGRYEYDEAAEVLADLDVVVVPSTTFETSSLVMALAMAANIPVIAQNVGAPPEIVCNGVNGYTFTPGDTRTLSGIMQSIVDNPGVLNSLRAAMKLPPRIEEEAFEYEQLFWSLIRPAQAQNS